MKVIFIILILSCIIVLLFFWQYVFSIYEVYYKIEPEHLYTFAESRVKVESIPLNALGFRAPFRKSPFLYEWESGKELVEIVDDRSETGYLILKAAGPEGTAVLRIKGKYALLPSIIEIKILPNLTDL